MSTGTRAPRRSEVLLSRPASTQFSVGSPEAAPAPVWRKVLYERQPFEDNYIDTSTFLQEMRENENVKNYEYTEVMIDTLAIVQELSVVVLFVFSFGMIYTGRMAKHTLPVVVTAIMLVTLVIYVEFLHMKRSSGSGSVGVGVAHPGETAAGAGRAAAALGESLEERPSSRFGIFCEFARQVVALGLLLLVLTPVLATLTVNYSDDTIAALSILTMTFHVLLADYNYLNAHTHHFSPNLSVNSAMFGVVLLASRISSPLGSGSLVVLGNICFSLAPIARHLIRAASLPAHVAVTALFFVLALACLAPIRILATVYLVVVATVTLAIPWCFVVLHSRAKNQINGPWDEAKPTNSAAAEEWANAT